MKKMVIFGATGTVGAYTALYMKKMGYEVIAIGKRKSDNGFFEAFRIPYFSVDIQKREDFAKLYQSEIKTVDYVFHAASIMPASMEGYSPSHYIYNIVEGTLNILEYCRTVNADRIIFTHSHSDTAHLQGTTTLIPADINRSFPLTGDHSVYAICKNAAVDLIEHYYHQYGLKRFVLRLPTIYAYTPNPYYYVNGEKKMMAYRYIIEKAINGETVEIWGDKNLKKEIVYVKDFCQIVEKSIEANHEGGIYNVGCGVGVTLEEQILGIIEVFSPQVSRAKVEYCPDKTNAKQFIHDISKTVNELGYEPQYSYHDGLVDFKIEMKKNRFKKLWS